MGWVTTNVSVQGKTYSKGDPIQIKVNDPWWYSCDASTKKGNLVSGTYYFYGRFDESYSKHPYNVSMRKGYADYFINDTTITAATYTVSYNANGGTGAPGNQTKTYGTTLTLSSTKPTRTGHTFSGWGTSATTSTVSYAAGASYKDNKAITLYAVWKVNTYTVKYNANGGSGTTANSSHVYGTAKVLTTNAFTRTGYTFAGWATSASGAKVYNDKASVTNLSSTNGATVNLYAVWTANTYTVTYNANGGSGTTANSSHTYGVAKTLTANGFTRTGYTFSGWATSASGSVVHSDKKSVSNLSSAKGGTVTLYAVWTANTYIIKYNSNGGSGTMSDTSCTYNVSKTLTTNAFVRTGYTFTGWSTSSTGSVVYSDKGTVLNLTSINNGIINLYAVWSANTYTVQYSPNGGNGTTSSSSHTYGTAKTLTENNFTRIGYTFGGWATSSSGAAVYSNKQSVVNLSTADNAVIQLYAVWRANSYMIKYNANGGSGSMADSSHTYDATSTLAANIFTRTGYTFSGWALSNTGSIVYSDKAVITNLTAVSNGTINLYAVWTANTYTIQYNANGGSGSMAASTHTYAIDKVLTKNTFTRIGYTFTGWGTSAAGNVVYTDGQTVKSLSSAVNGSITLYAIWSVNTYVIRYNANGGTGSMLDSNHTYTVAKALTANSFIRTGYAFAGWAISSSGGVVYTDKSSVLNLTSDKGGIFNLYAVWTANTYVIQYNANGGNGSMAASSYKYDEEKALSTNTFTRFGYIFDGWSQNREAQAAEYRDGQIVKNLTSQINGSVVLYAVWILDASINIQVSETEMKPGFPHAFLSGEWKKGYAYLYTNGDWKQGGA